MRPAGLQPVGLSPAGLRPLVRVLLLVPTLLAGCVFASSPPSSAPASPSSSPPISVAVSQARTQVQGALRAAGVGLIDARTPVRPAEPPALAAAPRAVLQAVLPADPSGGYIVVYELADPGAALAAGRELAAYVGTGPGRILYSPDARFVLRQVGATLVFFWWSPELSPDPETARVATALQLIGTEVAVPRS